jgi:hypothetical protein
MNGFDDEGGKTTMCGACSDFPMVGFFCPIVSFFGE